MYALYSKIPAESESRMALARIEEDEFGLNEEWTPMPMAHPMGVMIMNRDPINAGRRHPLISISLILVPNATPSKN